MAAITKPSNGNAESPEAFETLIEGRLEEVLKACQAGAASDNEAELISQIEPVLSSFVVATGSAPEVIKAERRVIIRDPDSTKKSAIIDRLFNTVVVEFEYPRCFGPVNEASKNKHAIKQVQEQVDALIAHEGWMEEKVSGVACDGARFIFCRRTGGSWIVEAPVPVDEKSVGRFLRLLASIRRPPMLPEVIAKRFGIEQEDVAVTTIREFFEALKGSDGKRSGALLQQWHEFYADVAGLDVKKLAADKDLQAFSQKITKRKTLTADDLARVLFSTYTYGAMLMKLLAVSAVTPFLSEKVSNPLTRLAHLSDDDLRSNLQEVETGEWFRRLGILNLCEGDFFSWYVDEWTPGVYRQVKKVVDVLDEYDPTIIEQTPERVRDLMKRIYHSLLPRRVRKTLGEYYTPDWLAERTLTLAEQVLWDEKVLEWKRPKDYVEQIVPLLRKARWLDPTCGSGTFLVMLLSRLKLHWRVARQMTKANSSEFIDCPSQGDFVRSLLDNVVGFDLNPLAVIASRVNFLLAIIDLLDPDDLRRNPIEIPVYLADSIVLPTANGNLFAKDKYLLPMRGIAKTFPVPIALATNERMPQLADLLHQDITAGVPVEAFLNSCRQQFALRPAEWDEAKEVLRDLFSILDGLHQSGRNGLWAAVAKNMFMPVFLAPVDYVIGNPPWVNWEGLPEAYRNASKGLWQEMGLFVHSGMDALLGKGKKDISTLCSYVASHRYLKAQGKLAFVITQSVFKTTGAGQGFRRFQIGSTDPLGVGVVEDFTDFQPFEDATNRTAVFVWQKGRATTYPLRSYRVWKKAARERPDFWATWKEAVPRLNSRTVWAEPADKSDKTASWLTAPRPALMGMRKVLGKSEYRAYAGAYSGGCNPVYWLHVLRRNPDGTVDVQMITEGAKKEVPGPYRHTIEPDFLYPLLRGKEVHRWHSERDPQAYFLMMQDPATRIGRPEAQIKANYPRLYAYLKRYRPQLLARASSSVKQLMNRGAFYSMFAVSDYTFAHYKVVWPNMGAIDLSASVVGGQGQVVIPQHIITMMPFEADQEDEAHYCAAVLNSSPYRSATIAYSQAGGKSFGAPHILEYARLPKMQLGNAVHSKLSALSKEAHRVKSGGQGRFLTEIEHEIDAVAASLWGLTDEELNALQTELKEQLS